MGNMQRLAETFEGPKRRNSATTDNTDPNTNRGTPRVGGEMSGDEATMIKSPQETPKEEDLQGRKAISM